MVDYETFKGIAEEHLNEYMPDGLLKEGMKMEAVPYYKINRKLDGVRLVRTGKGDGQAGPRLCINDMYAKYQINGSIKETLSEAARMLAYLSGGRGPSAQSILLNEMEDRVVMQLVNTEWNKELLQVLPHRGFCDLSVIYSVVVVAYGNTVETVTVTNGLAEKLGMDEPALYGKAMENMKRLYPPRVMVMDGLIKALSGRKEPGGMMAGETQTPPIYVVTNRMMLNGASSVLCGGVLDDLAGKLGTDFYLLPSSVHEMLAVPADGADPRELAVMVEEINRSEVDIKDRLSNQIYYYDRERKRVAPVAGMPVEGLDMAKAQTPATARIKNGVR